MEPPRLGTDRKLNFGNSSTWLLVAANLVPVAGVALWKWQVRDLVILYWIETVVVCLFFVLRILCASADPRAQQAQSIEAVPEQGAPREVSAGVWPVAAFFFVFLGGFCFILGMFLVAFFHPVNQPESGIGTLVGALLREGGAYPAVLAIIASHAYSFWRNDPFGRREYSDAEKLANLFGPLKRIAVTQVVVMVGGFSLLGAEGQLVPMLMLVTAKTGVDAYLHAIAT